MTEDTAAPATVVTVTGHDETPDRDPEIARWVDVARKTLEGEGVATGHLDLFLVGTDDIAALNAEHLGGTGPTDVLAFPLDGPDLGASASEPGPLHLGDVVVCPAVASAQAGSSGGGYEAEMTLLVVHGVLHVLGHDHAEPDDTALMRNRERHHLTTFGLPHPVLDR